MVTFSINNCLKCGKLRAKLKINFVFYLPINILQINNLASYCHLDLSFSHIRPSCKLHDHRLLFGISFFFTKMGISYLKDQALKSRISDKTKHAIYVMLKSPKRFSFSFFFSVDLAV